MTSVDTATLMRMNIGVVNFVCKFVKKIKISEVFAKLRFCVLGSQDVLPQLRPFELCPRLGGAVFPLLFSGARVISLLRSSKSPAFRIPA